MEWREDAACAELPWEYRIWFFGEGPQLPVHEQHERARMVCYLCPVQFECLSYWIDTLEEFGIWGGLTVSQRKRYLTPKLRKSYSREEAMMEVVADLGMRMLPKIEEAFLQANLPVPDIPVQGRVGRKVLVEILSSEEKAAA